jgi:hypothetical protein
MARCLLIQNDTVVNIVEFPDNDIPEVYEDMDVVQDPGGFNVGDVFSMAPVWTSRFRQRAIDKMADVDLHGKALRAIVAVMIDEINILRANAGLGQRTLNQARNAIINKINQGAVDA